MNITLWIIQALLALVFLGAGVIKMVRSKEQLAGRMEWVEDFSPNAIRFIGVAEALGALGLILPAATGILPWLTPTAAVGLALVMVGAAITHVRHSESSRMVMPIILLALAALVAYGRLVLVPALNAA